MATTEPKTKQEKYEIKIQQGKKLLKEIEEDFKKTLVVFFRSLVNNRDINVNNIDDLLVRHFTKEKDRQNFRAQFDDLIAKEVKQNKNDSKQKPGKNEKPADDPTIIDETLITDQPADESTIIGESSIEYQTPDYIDKEAREPEYAHN